MQAQGSKRSAKVMAQGKRALEKAAQKAGSMKRGASGRVAGVTPATGGGDDAAVAVAVVPASPS
ncbi:hypothetical protein EON66_03625 [archaeon]|nr:MAG: hypothetical protein EON66_03625 [archaeon]